MNNITLDMNSGVTTCSSLKSLCVFSVIVSLTEHKSPLEAFENPEWTIAMQEELNLFKRN